MWKEETGKYGVARRWTAALVVVAAVVALTGCAVGNGSETAAERTELIVSAAASLTDALQELEATYEETNRGVDLLLNFGSSGALQKQIEQGAPADLFISAGTSQMKALVSQDLVEPDTEVTLLLNELVVIVPAEGGATVNEAADLLADGIGTIAIGEPDTVPAGGYAKEAMEHYGIWEKIEPKLVLGKDVRQVLTYVETGNVDAGWVYRTDAASSDTVRVAFAAGADSHAPIAYPAAVVRASSNLEEARKLLDYLQSDEADRLFESHGFRIPAEP